MEAEVVAAQAVGRPQDQADPAGLLLLAAAVTGTSLTLVTVILLGTQTGILITILIASTFKKLSLPTRPMLSASLSVANVEDSHSI